MEYLTLFITPIIGAIIAYCTNWLAIIMLFRPHYPKYIFGKRIPFTPGLIPKEQANLAKKMAAAVGSHIITPEMLTQRLLSSPVLLAGAKDIKEAIRHNLPQGAAYIMQLESPNMDAQGAALVKTLIKENVGRFSGMFLNPDKIYAGIKEGIMDYLAKEENLEGIADKIDEWIDELCFQDSSEAMAQKKALAISALQKIAAQAVRHMDIETMIEEQINTFNPQEAEALILSVVKRELKMVVALGGVLGFIIGWIPVLLH
ncbi:MAG: DUF445 family protein [Defluviitaleaceae bacterium]|nr:DUF445 family protein [Defluviitaleaceae bacterium]